MIEKSKPILHLPILFIQVLPLLLSQFYPTTVSLLSSPLQPHPPVLPHHLHLQDLEVGTEAEILLLESKPDIFKRQN